MFVVLYAPLIIGVLFSLVEIRQGKILLGDVQLPPLCDACGRTTACWRRCRTRRSSPWSRSPSLAVLAILLALYTEWEGAIGRRFLELIIYLPFLLPPIVTGLALLVASAELGINRGVVTIIVGHTVFVLAVAYRLVLTRLQALPPSLVEASFDLGASRWQTLRYVLLPHLASAVMTGAVLALTLSFDETLITTFVAGDQMTLPLRLWAMMRVGFTPEINALVTLVLLVSIALAIVIAWRLEAQGRDRGGLR